MNLEEIRKEIDKIDDNINELFQKRMEMVLAVAEYKRENNLHVLNSERERKIVGRVTSACPEETALYTKILFSTMFDLSRSYQCKLLETGGGIDDSIKNAMEHTPKVMPQRASVACQGIEGAYSQQACDKLFPIPSVVYFKNFSGVFEAVEKGLCKYGVLPVENSIHGSVTEVYDLMRRYNFYIVKSVKLKLDNVLLAKPGAKLEDITDIYSHEQALFQCDKYLKSLDAQIHTCENTAVAAQMAASAEDLGVAAIASRNCGEIYGLNVLKENIANNDSNFTRFILISKNLEIYPGANKTSVVLTTAHKPGSLYEVISRFAAMGINLTKIESRPIAGRDFEFLFYLDMEADVYSEGVKTLLSELERRQKITYLGSYSEI